MIQPPRSTITVTAERSSRWIKDPIAAEFTESNQPPEETAMRITRDSLAVEIFQYMNNINYIFFFK